MPYPPQVYLIGAQKAGTTSLASYLALHPSICVSEPKEPHYFSNNWSRDEAWYRNCFSHAKPEDILIDASTSYTMARLGEQALVQVDNPYFGMAERIRSLSTSPKFVYMLRDPIKRTYSAYWHRVRAAEENRSFQEAVIDNLDENNFYIRPSLYVEQLSAYLEEFPLDDFCFPLFELFVKNPQQSMAEIYHFVGVDVIQLPQISVKNASYSYSGVGRILQLDIVNKIVKMIVPYIPDAVKVAGKRSMTKGIPAIDIEHQAILKKYFSPYNQALSDLVGVDISPWN